jgi:hypothetical protein
MKQFITSVALLLLPMFIFSQDITGLWKGTMSDDSGNHSMPYEVLIKKEKGKFTGFVQSWYLIGGKEYYDIRKVKVSVAKDKKIVIKDASILEHNLPVEPDKNIHQLDVLDLKNINNDFAMNGVFVTNLTKKYNEVTGLINIKKINNYSESTLMQYFKKKEAGNEVAVAK